jgi:hypothetical protein
LDHRNSERKFKSEVLYLFLYAFILFMVNRNAIIEILLVIA